MLTPIQHHFHHCEQSEGVCWKIGMTSMSEITDRYESISDMNFISAGRLDWYKKVYPWWARISRLLTSSVEPLLLQYSESQSLERGREGALRQLWAETLKLRERDPNWEERERETCALSNYCCWQKLDVALSRSKVQLGPSLDLL